MKILIVDDEFVSRTKLKLIMENFGPCEDAEHGITVLTEIRRAERYLNIPDDQRATILMVTSYGDKDRIVACAQSGCNDYIVKPFDRVIIREKLARLGIIELTPEDEVAEIQNPAPTGASHFIEEIYFKRFNKNQPELSGYKCCP